MENKFESIIRGRELEESKEDVSKLSKQELEQRRKDIIKDLTSNFTEKEVDKQTNPTVKRLMSEIQEIDKYLESKEVKVEENSKEQLTEGTAHKGLRVYTFSVDVVANKYADYDLMASEISEELINEDFKVISSTFTGDSTEFYKNDIDDMIENGILDYE